MALGKCRPKTRRYVRRRQFILGRTSRPSRYLSTVRAVVKCSGARKRLNQLPDNMLARQTVAKRPAIRRRRLLARPLPKPNSRLPARCGNISSSRKSRVSRSYQSPGTLTAHQDQRLAHCSAPWAGVQSVTGTKAVVAPGRDTAVAAWRLCGHGE